MNKTELKYNVMATGSYFFDRSSMRFFGDTMANYYVSKNTALITTSLGEHHVCHILTRVKPVKHGLINNAYFDIDTFERVIKSEVAA